MKLLGTAVSETHNEAPPQVTSVEIAKLGFLLLPSVRAGAKPGHLRVSLHLPRAFP